MLINFTTFYFSINFSILLTLVCLVFSFQGAFFLFFEGLYPSKPNSKNNSTYTP